MFDSGMVFFWISLGLSAGILLREYGPQVSVFYAWPAIALLLACLWLVRGQRAFWIFLLAAFSIFGYLRAVQDSARPWAAIEHFIPLGQRGPVALNGEVKTFPEVKVRGKQKIVSFVVSAREIFTPSPAGPWKRFEARGDVQVFAFQCAARIRRGARVRIFGRLREPPGARNPGEFDYGRFLKRRGIHGLMNAYGMKSVRLSNPEYPLGFMGVLELLRGAIDQRLVRLFDPETAGIFKALILGSRSGVSEVWNEKFIQTGTSHLLAVSGLNVALLAGTFYFFLLWRGLSQKKAAALALGLAVLQVWIGGAGIPLERAGWMAGVGFLAILREREYHSLNALFLAASLMLWSGTRDLGEVSFQLSFLAVFSLICFAKWTRVSRPWLECLGSSLAVLIGTWPFSIYHFNFVSLLSLPANLLAIPFFHLALLGGILAVGIPVSPVDSLAGWAGAQCLKAGLGWIDFWSHFTFGCMRFLAPPVWKIIFYYAALGAALMSRNAYTKGRPALPMLAWSLWALAAGLFFLKPATKADFSLTLFSAPGNIAHLGMGPGREWLINTGTGYPGREAKKILEPFLKQKGVDRLSGILLTGLTPRKSGGLETLVRQFEPKYFVRPWDPRSPEMETRPGPRLRWKSLGRGERIVFSDAREIRILDASGGHMTFAVDYPGLTIYFIPPKMGAAAKGWRKTRNPMEPRREVFVFETDAVVPEGLWDKSGRSGPSPIFVAWKFSEGARARLKNSGIGIYELEKSGAIRFEAAPGRPPAAYSFLAGKLNPEF